MGIQDRDYYWEKRGGVRPGKWARLRASLWLVLQVCHHIAYGGGRQFKP